MPATITPSGTAPAAEPPLVPLPRRESLLLRLFRRLDDNLVEL